MKTISPPETVFVIVKATHCKDHVKPSVQGVYLEGLLANVICTSISPFGSCGKCTYTVREYGIK